MAPNSVIPLEYERRPAARALPLLRLLFASALVAASLYYLLLYAHYVIEDYYRFEGPSILDAMDARRHCIYRDMVPYSRLPPSGPPKLAAFSLTEGVEGGLNLLLIPPSIPAIPAAAIVAWAAPRLWWLLHTALLLRLRSRGGAESLSRQSRVIVEAQAPDDDGERG